MRSAKTIAADVDRGLAIVAEQKRLKEELDALETRLIKDALERPDEHVPLADEQREGRQFIARGTDVALPIVFTADKLVATFTEEGAIAKRIMDALPYPQFDRFYKKVVGYAMIPKDGQRFRVLAAELLGPEAPAFIKACRAVDKFGIPKSDEKIEWHAAAAGKGLEVEA